MKRKQETPAPVKPKARTRTFTIDASARTQSIDKLAELLHAARQLGFDCRLTGHYDGDTMFRYGNGLSTEDWFAITSRVDALGEDSA